MARIYNDLTELIGRTPLVEAGRLMQSEDLKARLLLKLERFNPGGSVKDRVALAMIEAAERGKALPKEGFCNENREKALPKEGIIIEPTSGNTGVGLAWVAAVKGYRLILTMPETMSIERRKLLTALGAELVLTPGSEGMAGAIRRAEELRKEHAGAIIPQQFENPANPAIHASTTAREIWEDTEGQVDIFVACVGTGGTISGTARGLKAHNPNIQAIAVEPATSAVLSGGKAGVHKIQGIGAGFIPKNYDEAVVDRIITVADEEAMQATRNLAKCEGILAGISSGAALHAALLLAREEENRGKTIVALLPDTGERYLSTELFG